MTYRTDNETLRALLRKSLSTIRDLNTRVALAQTESPIAVIGTSCALPGDVGSLEQYWDLLLSGSSCDSIEPSGDWRRRIFDDYFARHPQLVRYARANYLTGDPMLFDARRFGITPVEARDMDPGQRLALTLTARAWENAGYDPRAVPGRVGVYFGVIGGEYGALARHTPHPGPYAATGGLDSVVSGRVGHVFDYAGPALSIDTACSSSLVALHLACMGIRAGDCDTAVVGGVNLLLDPALFTGLAEFGALSTTGRCHSFCAGGDGYARGEGGGVLILKRLDHARRDRDRVLALVESTAINHDGTASGLTVPSGAAQRRLLDAALRRAGRSPEGIDYLEAHGTGTALGDPIELSAAADVLCRDRDPDRPLLVGSVKSQIGHLEAAAGVAALLKLILVLRHRRVPAQVLPTRLNPALDLSAGLRIPVEHTELGGEVVVGAVSSFGFSGTNAHAVLRSPDAEPARTGGGSARHMLLLSGPTAAGLSERVSDVLGHLRAHPTAPVGDVCLTSALGRRHGEHRLYASAADLPGLVRALETHAGTPRFTTGSRLKRGGTVEIAGFLVGDLDTEPPAETRPLYREFPGFRTGYDEITQAWTARTASPAPNWIDGDPPDEVERAVALLATLCGSVALWREFGVAPSMWCPSGIGVFATAVATGLLAPEHAVDCAIRFATADPAAEAITPDGLEHVARTVEAMIVCPRDGGFVTAASLRKPGYWIHAARATADSAAQARVCAEQEMRIGLVLGAGRDADGARVHAHLEVLDYDHEGGDAYEMLAPVLARLFELGVDLDWWPWYRHGPARRTLLPGTRFDEQPHYPEWSVIPFTAPERPRSPSSDPLTPQVRTGPPSRGVEFDFMLDPAAVPVSDTHELVHIGYFVEMLLRACAIHGTDAAPAIDSMLFTAPLIVRGPTQVRLILAETTGAARSFEFHAMTDPATGRWQRHVHGTVVARTAADTAVAPLHRPPTRALTGEEFYSGLSAQGLELGPSVRLIADIGRDESQLVAELVTASTEPMHARVSPGVLDAAAQLFHLTTTDGRTGSGSVVVRSIHDLVLHPGASVAARHLRITEIAEEPGELVRGRVSVHAADATPILEFTCAMRRLGDGIAAVTATGDDSAASALTLACRTAIRDGDPGAVHGVVDAVRQLLADLTGLPVGDISAGDDTATLGMDSLQAGRLYRMVTPLHPRFELADLIRGMSAAEITEHLLPQRSSPKLSPISRPYNGTRPASAGEHALVCIPYGGGDIGIFRDWDAALPVPVAPIALPGRGARLADPLVPDIYRLVDDIAAGLPATGRVSIYGHSMGALVGYLLAVRHPQLVEHLFVAACSSPSPRGNRFHRECLRRLQGAGYDRLPTPAEVTALEDDALAQLADLLAFPADIAASDPAVLRLNLPVLVNDIAVVAGFRYPDAAVLDIPITALHGSRDDRVPEPDMRDWRGWTTGTFELHVVDGDHFFAHREQDLDHVLKVLGAALER